MCFACSAFFTLVKLGNVDKYQNCTGADTQQSDPEPQIYGVTGTGNVTLSIQLGKDNIGFPDFLRTVGIPEQLSTGGTVPVFDVTGSVPSGCLGFHIFQSGVVIRGCFSMESTAFFTLCPVDTGGGSGAGKRLIDGASDSLAVPAMGVGSVEGPGGEVMGGLGSPEHIAAFAQNGSRAVSIVGTKVSFRCIGYGTAFIFADMPVLLIVLLPWAREVMIFCGSQTENRFVRDSPDLRDGGVQNNALRAENGNILRIVRQTGV